MNFKDNYLIILFALGCSIMSLAQDRIIINAYILDSETKQPIPYVNIGFVGKSIGTVTNEEGKFRLVYDEFDITLKDPLQISALGYETLVVYPRQFMRSLTNSDKIYLKPQPEILDEVVITNEKRREELLGSMSLHSDALGYWKDKIALGGEIGAKIKVKHENSKLLNFKFDIVENLSDSLKIRVNVYDYKRRFPSEKLLKQNLFYTIKQREGEVDIDLSPYNVTVDDDFVIALELIEVYGDTIEFSVAGKTYGGVSYFRYISQDKWNRQSTIGLNFRVLSSIPDNTQEVSTKRDKPSKVTLYWDASLAMNNKDFSKEFKLIEDYFEEYQYLEVEVIKFNNDIISNRLFTINNGNSDELVDHLKNTMYEGAVNYQKILKENNFGAEAILLFTDGHSLLSRAKTEVYIPTFVISSNTKANHTELQEIGLYADGHYINLNKTDRKTALEYLFNEVQDTIDYTKEILEENIIQGKVFSVSGPIQGANIRLKNTFIEAQSDVEGFFEINANEDDILVVNYLGMEEKEYRIVNPRTVAILLEPEGELLDEVVVEGRKKNENEVDTAFGKRNEDAVGYDVNVITEDDIKPYYNTLADVITGRFPGVRVAGLNIGGVTPKFMIRDGGGTNVVFASLDIDGIIYGPDQEIPPVDIQNIYSINILKSLAASNRYGALGRGGVIVIKTKTAMGTDETQEINSALIKGNDYEEEGVLLLSKAEEDLPDYIKTLKKATTYDGALELYRELRRTDELKTVPFYLNVSDYFLRWDKELAYSILTNIATVADKNPKALMTLAFKMEALNKLEDAQNIYERIAELRPYHEQPYRDLARIYTANKHYKKAMNLYKRMLANAIEGVQFIGLQEVIENELMHLLAFNRSKVDYYDLPNELRTAKFKKDLRIVFQWNDPNTEFELQFVSPQKKFYKWSHTKYESKDFLLDEIKYGYSTEQFVIDDATPGEWIINLECLSKESLVNPTYLKYTVFKNFGLPEETKEVKVIKLYKHQQKVTIDKFMYE